MKELAEALKHRAGLQMRQGVVTAVTGSTNSVLLGGSDVPVDEVQHLNSCAPQIGDVVWITSDGADSDAWKNARRLAAAAGLDLYMDGDGVAQVRDTPDPESTPVCATYYGGDSGIVLTRTRRAMLSQLYNGVVVWAEGSNVGVPKRGEAWDDDPSSPTYCDGPMGRVPMFYTSPLLTSQSDVDSAAETTLARVKRPVQQVVFTMVPNPAHEAFDVVEIEDPDETMRRFMLDVVTIPLDNSGAMTATAREAEVT